MGSGRRASTGRPAPPLEGCPEPGHGGALWQREKGIQRRGDWDLSTEESGRKGLPGQSSGTMTSQGDTPGNILANSLLCSQTVSAFLSILPPKKW